MSRLVLLVAPLLRHPTLQSYSFFLEVLVLLIARCCDGLPSFAPNRLFRDRSAEDDFQLAVQSLGVGHADEGVHGEEAVGREDRQPPDVGTADEQDGVEVDGSGAAGTKAAANNAAGNKAAGREAAGSGATMKTASPPEHPLQKAITSFDMALGELNQLVHLVDLARAGEFMVLERVTPAEEDQARAMPDNSVRYLRSTYIRTGAVYHANTAVLLRPWQTKCIHNGTW